MNFGSHNLAIEWGGQINLTQSRKNAWSSTTENTQDNQPAHDDNVHFDNIDNTPATSAHAANTNAHAAALDEIKNMVSIS